MSISRSRWVAIGVVAIGLGILGIGVFLAGRSTSLIEPNTNPGNSTLTQTPLSNAAGSKRDVSVPAEKAWTSTGVVITAGQRLKISATGKGVWKNISKDNPNAQPNAYEECGPDGTSPNSKDYFSNIQQYQTPKANKGALIGKIGDNGVPFKIGSNFTQVADQDGLLYLGINEMRLEFDSTSYNDNNGYFLASILIDNVKTERAIMPLRPVKTVPSGRLVQDVRGFYYLNSNNDLQLGVSYKNKDNPRVYVFDGKLLRPFADEPAFLKFYNCGDEPRIIDCAPIYELPTGPLNPIGPEIK